MAENLAMSWINDKKTYDMIIKCLKVYKIFDKIIKFITNAKENWREELTAGGQTLAEVKIQRGIFQGHSISPLLFVIEMMPLNFALRNCARSYKFTKSHETINYLINRGDINLFTKNENELETMMQTIRVYNRDIGVEFSTKNVPCW